MVPQLTIILTVSEKKTSKLDITGPIPRKIHRWPVHFQHSGTVMPQKFQYHDININVAPKA